MNVDIWGRPLRPGHCEVHPEVHQEYPCSLCDMEERERRRRFAPPEPPHRPSLSLSQIETLGRAMAFAVQYLNQAEYDDAIEGLRALRAELTKEET